MNVNARALYGFGTRARELYAELCQGRYAGTRTNPAAVLAARHLSCAKTWLLIGAGPDPRSELAAMACRYLAPNQRYDARIIVHDVDTLSADSVAKRIERLGGNVVALSVQDLSEWDGELTEAVDAATVLGYTYANLPRSTRFHFLSAIRAKRILVDVPIADAAVDPYVGAAGTIPPGMDPIIPWAREIATASRCNPDTLAAQTSRYTDGYDIRVYATARTSGNVVRAHDPVRLINFSRRTLAAWLAEFAAAGWDVDAVEVVRDDAHPLARAAVVLNCRSRA